MPTFRAHAISVGMTLCILGLLPGGFGVSTDTAESRHDSHLSTLSQSHHLLEDSDSAESESDYLQKDDFTDEESEFQNKEISPDSVAIVHDNTDDRTDDKIDDSADDDADFDTNSDGPASSNRHDHDTHQISHHKRQQKSKNHPVSISQRASSIAESKHSEVSSRANLSGHGNGEEKMKKRKNQTKKSHNKSQQKSHTKSHSVTPKLNQKTSTEIQKKKNSMEHNGRPSFSAPERKAILEEALKEWRMKSIVKAKTSE
jgi:hypothetical protein